MAVLVRSKLSRGTEVQLSPFHKIVYRCQQMLQISPNRIVWDHPKILVEMWTVNKGRGKSDMKELLSERKCNYWTKSSRRSCLRNLSFGLMKKNAKKFGNIQWGGIVVSDRFYTGENTFRFPSIHFSSHCNPQIHHSYPYGNVLISATERKTDDPTNSHQFWMLPWVPGLNFFLPILSHPFLFPSHLLPLPLWPLTTTEDFGLPGRSSFWCYKSVTRTVEELYVV